MLPKVPRSDIFKVRDKQSKAKQSKKSSIKLIGSLAPASAQVGLMLRLTYILPRQEIKMHVLGPSQAQPYFNFSA